VAFRGELGHTTFDKVDAAAAAAFTEVTEGIEPFPAPTIVRGTLNGKAVENPSSYMALFGRANDPTVYPNATDWQRVELTGTRPSPWTDDVLVLVSPTKRIVEVGGLGLARLDEDEAAAVSARTALPVGDDGFRWTLVAVASALAFAVVAVLLLSLQFARRKTGAVETRPAAVSRP
jgi:hypothetical protein